MTVTWKTHIKRIVGLFLPTSYFSYKTLLTMKNIVSDQKNTHKVMPLREHNIFSLKIILSNERAWKAHFK